MSASRVAKTIRSIASRHRLSAPDVVRIIDAAEKNSLGRRDGVTNVEARDIQFFAATNADRFDDDARAILDAFMVRNDLPYGTNRAPMRERMRAVLEKVSLDAPLTRPPRIDCFQPVRLSDEPRRDAYYDAVKQEFFVRDAGGTYGPFDLPSATSRATRRLQRALAKSRCDGGTYSLG